MVHDNVFEDGRKSQILEEKLIDLCDLADESATAFGFRSDSPEGVKTELQEAYKEYSALMANYDRAIPESVQARYEEVLGLIQ